ncbi:MAG: hypothetical protein KDD70_13310, partial [Bdellovibrionales bacterium]|nr:hypothetical protein [Bdellovibrionales bacterium]
MIDKVTVPAGTTWQDLRTLLSGTLRNEAALLQSPVGREVTTDSRRVEEGSVFVAYRGVYQDGHQYLPQAVESGAALCILEDDEGIPSGIPAIVVEDARFAISKLSAFCSGYPTRQVKTFGITGTNGKTTNLWLLSEALRLLRERVITLGTLGVLFEGETYSKGEATTPTAQEIHSSIAHALRLGATACVMEVSSHALKQRRADDVCFDGAIFTNLTPDHLNYHPDEEDYFQAKKRLFELTLSNSPEAPLVCGRFDDYGRRLSDWAKEQSSRAYSFGMDSECDFILQELA